MNSQFAGGDWSVTTVINSSVRALPCVRIISRVSKVMSRRITRTAEAVRETDGTYAPHRAGSKGTRLKFKAVRLSRRAKKELGEKRLDESATLRLEKQIPRLAKNATALAFRRALTSGNKVLIAEAGELVEVLADGTRRAVKKLEPSVKMRKGQVIKLK
jgi:hypothetical protein